MARFAAVPTNITVVSAYAPHSALDPEVQEDFWSSLSSLLGRVPGADYLFVGTDANARLFSSDQPAPGSGVGRFAGNPANLTVNTVSLMALLREHGLTAANTWLQPRSQKKLLTFRCAHFRAQLDYALVRNRHIGSVQRCKVLWGNQLSSDHGCLRLTVRWRLKRLPKRPPAPPAYDYRMLFSEGVRRRYQAAVDKYLDVRPLPDDLPADIRADCLWDRISTAVTQAAAETIPLIPNRARPWLTAEAVEAGTHAGRLRSNPSVSRAEQREAYNAYRRLRRRDQIARSERFRDALAAAHADQDLHLLFKLTKDFDPSKLPTVPESKRREISSNFSALLTPAPGEPPTASLRPTEFTSHVPMLSETIAAIHSLQLGRVPGHDGIPSDLLRRGSTTLFSAVHEFVVACWESTTIPARASIGHIVLLPKKRNPREAGDYRGISLLPTL